MRTHDSFPQFARFPLELRRLIWFRCLPRRILEEDVPYTLLDGQDSRQACWPIKTTFQNARVPLIASINREARQTALEWGQIQKSQDHASLEVVWLQPKIDMALHVNWTRRRNDAFFQVYDAYIPPVYDTPIGMLIYRARWECGTQISLLGDVIYPFNVGEVMMDTALSNSEPVASIYTISNTTSERERDIDAIIALADNLPINLTLVAISLHIDMAAALASGLFGLLGDTPIQTIDFDDIPRIRQFYELYNTDPAKVAEPHVDKLFTLILGLKFHAAVLSWKKKATWLLQACLWKRMQRDDPGSFRGSDPGLLWTPPVSKEQRYIRIDEHTPNEDHSWWRDHAEEYTPKVVPQIMVRLCSNQCYREENRPEEFGDV